MSNKTIETFEFKTEVNQLLNLVIHSLYSHKDIFLRELISNASDALDKVRFESLQNAALLGANTNLQIKLIRDEKQNTLTISDNGIGMNKDELITNLGTIAKSGTKEFIEKVKQAKGNLDLIGQFGVGFYSAFMVADKIAVISKPVEGQAYAWTSAGESKFELDTADKQTRGTDIVLHLKNDCKEYLEEFKLREIIKKYSDFVEYPIVMDIERDKKITEETLNSQKALWTKNKSEITKEENIDFYKHISHDFHEPLETIHYSAEGTSEFKALLYIPEKAPADLFMRESVKGIHLYIKRVFIMNDCKKLIPEYLRFINGVVDSNDLPLNVSREILQEDAQLNKIQKNIVKKVLATLKVLKDKEKDKYLKFYKEFGTVLKEGLHYDYENKEAITELLLFETNKTEAGNYRSLEEYVNAMPKDQKEIYYITAADRQTALASPQLEVFKTKGYEVLLMIDPVDEWVIPQLMEYKGKKLKSADKGDLDLGDKKEKEEKTKQAQDKFGSLIEELKKVIGDKVKDIRFSHRLTDSSCCLVADEHAMSEQMLKMFKAMGQEMPAEKKILEINPDHPLINVLNSIAKDQEQFKDYARMLYDQALIAGGSKPEDPLNFAKKLSELMVKAAK